jgi:hypothetical protein
MAHLKVAATYCKIKGRCFYVAATFRWAICFWCGGFAPSHFPFHGGSQNFAGEIRFFQSIVNDPE